MLIGHNIGDLKINSLSNNFDQLREIVLKYVLDNTFLTFQFLVVGL